MWMRYFHRAPKCNYSYVSVEMCVCMCGVACMYVQLCACMWVPEDNLGGHPQDCCSSLLR